LQKILALDTPIRFTGKIMDEELVSTARNDDIPLFDKDLAALAHHPVLCKGHDGQNVHG